VNPLGAAARSTSWPISRRCWIFRPHPSSTFGKLDPAKATQAEMRGQEVLRQGQCATPQPPFYTDNLMHNLLTERFFKPVMINNMMAVGDGPVKTFRCSKQPALPARRASSTLEDTVDSST
jgi:hypothetical protein